MSEEFKSRIGKDLLTLAEATKKIAESRIADGDWSGMPLPVPGLKLVLEPRYPHQAMAEFQWKECYDEDGNRHVIEEQKPPEKSEYTTRNSWWSDRLHMTVHVLHDKQGRARFSVSWQNRLSLTLQTMEAASAWPLEAEKKAKTKLATLIPADAFELYELTGHFTEVSKRSQLIYLFRKGRPTVVLSESEHGDRALCALCLHPIGYYGDSWAGVMCPTDEVIAHLLMMRGSEEKFWANANQHPIEHWAAGV